MGSPGQYTGRSLGSVKLLERIGSGGMGEVYRGFHEVLEMEVAIKVILPNQTTNADFVKRFIREAQACAQLSHPNILRVFTADKQDDLYYIVLEYVDGTDLKVVLRRHKQIPWEKTVAIVEQACEGLAYAHKKGIVHRDIKPDNLLISRRGEIKIADFGLATIRAEVTGITAMGQVLGTPLYMSPEQCDGQTADWRSDIYSLGATWYHLIAGRPPYTGDSTAAVIAQHLIKDVAFPKDKFERVPERIRALIAWMMRRDRDHRVQNLEEIRAQLVAIDHASQRERREVVKEVVDVTRRLEAQQYRGPATSSASNGQLTPHVYQEALPMGPDGTDLRSSGRLPTMPNRHPSSSNRIPAPNMGSGEPSRSSQQMPVFASPDSRSSSRLPTTPPPAPPLRDSSPSPMQVVPMVPVEVRKSTPMVPPQPVALPADPPPLMPPPPPPRSANALSSSSASIDTTAARAAATRADRISGMHPVPSSSGTWRAPASRAATPPPGSTRAVEFGSESTEDVPVGGASPWASGGVVGVPAHGHSGSAHRPANSNFPDASANDGANRVLVVVLLLLVVGALVGMVVMLAYGVNPDPSSNHVPPTTVRPAWIYFSRELSPAESDLYKIRVDGQELIQVTSKPGREFFPAVSSRGNRVAFVHQHEGKSDVVSVTTDGTETWARMTESLAGGVRGPLGWADSNDALYFIDDAGNFCTLSLRQIDGGSLRRQRVGDRHIAQFELDPHSPRRLIFTEIGRGGISHLWAVPMEPMTDPKRLGLAANVVHPRLSPNGQRLLYMEADFDDPGFGQLNVADRNGLHPMPIELDHLRAYGRPAWTPDGRIVFAAKYVPPDTAGSSSEFARAPWLEWNLYVIEPPTHAVPKKTPVPLLAEPWRVTEIDCGPGQ